MTIIVLIILYIAVADYCTLVGVKKTFTAWMLKNSKKFFWIYGLVHLSLFILFLNSLPSASARPIRAFTFMFFLTVYACKLFIILSQVLIFLLSLFNSLKKKLAGNQNLERVNKEIDLTGNENLYLGNEEINKVQAGNPNLLPGTEEAGKKSQNVLSLTGNNSVIQRSALDGSEIEPATLNSKPTLNRSQFIARTGFALASIPFIGLNAGMIKGVYDYRVRKVKLVLPNLPKSFDGLQIAQISDIHSGSFYNKKAVALGVDLLQSLKADVIFFTGDLVNDMADEMKDYQDIFSRVKAPLGVFSVLGNHDYGDYAWWPDARSKKANLENIKKIHGLMGYQLLTNEHRKLRIGSDEIAILGVENWGSYSRFPKYGRVEDALRGAEDAPIKLLLSHDPTHWKAKVIPDFNSIDVTFSGHTHGMQMGIRTAEFQWSPIEYFYKEWAGLYHEGRQSLYVNVGYGFLGYPGRLGMNPEITLFTLSKGA